MIPQSTIDSFKRDPLGSVTAMVNDPKSVLKNINIEIPDSVRSLSDMVPQSIKDKIVPKELQELVGGTVPSATVPRIDTDTPESVTPPPPASSRKIDIAPPVRRAPSPLPIIQEEEEQVLREPIPQPVQERAPSPLHEPEHEKKEVVNMDGGIIVPNDETKIQIPTTIEIKPEDLETIKAFMESRNVEHVIR